MSTSAPMQFMPTLPPEEVARANFYGLLARLFHAAPDEALLQAIAACEGLEAEDGDIAPAWQDLARAAAEADPEAVREEYDAAFIGTGKSPVTLYTCAYSMKFTNEVPLVELKAALAAMGVARREEGHEPEDHIAALCETMRFLISVKFASLDEQKVFFERWIWPTAEGLCSAIDRSSATDFYKAVARFHFQLCTLEHMAFEML